MHDRTLAEGILAVALGVADREPVRAIRLRVGELRHVTEDALQVCFELVARDTTAAEARLELTPVPVRIRCDGCGREGRAGLSRLCPRCGRGDATTVSGDELLIDAVQLETGWRRRPGAEGDPG